MNSALFQGVQCRMVLVIILSNLLGETRIIIIIIIIIIQIITRAVETYRNWSVFPF